MLENLKIGPKPTIKTIDLLEQDVFFNLQKPSEHPDVIEKLVVSKGREFRNFPLSARNNFRNTSPASSFIAAAREVREYLASGQTVYLHCNEGIHRTSMVTLAIVLDFEREIENALKIIREMREECFLALTEQQNWRANYVKSAVECD